MMIITICFLLVVFAIFACYAFKMRKDAYHLETFSDARISNEKDSNENIEETLEKLDKSLNGETIEENGDNPIKNL